jgi:glucose-6-phosphate 1-dehydrogenase
VYYEHGNYSGCDGMSKLDERLQQVEGAGEANRIFYLSLPHNVVLEVATCLSADAQSKRGWTRLILEKPFGFDSESSARINQGLLRGLDENQIYRSVTCGNQLALGI